MPPLPGVRPSRVAPWHCAASSTIPTWPGSWARSAVTSAICPYRCTGTTARVAGPTAANAACGSRRYVSGRQSARTGRAPILATAPAVAMKVLAGTTTSSPGPTPLARRASSTASVPLPTPTQCATPPNSAYSRSKAATSSPPMNAVFASTRSNPARTSSATSAWAALRSTSGIWFIRLVPPVVASARAVPTVRRARARAPRAAVGPGSPPRPRPAVRRRARRTPSRSATRRRPSCPP